MHTHVDEHEIFKIDIKLSARVMESSNLTLYSAMLLVLCVFPVVTFTM